MERNLRKARSFRYLALSGGGVKGHVYLGARWTLERIGIWKDIREIAGTSAGALYGSLFATGSDFWQLMGIYHLTDTAKLVGPLLNPFNLWRVAREGGLLNTGGIRNWLGDIFRVQTGNADLTFGELANLAEKNPRFRKLVICAVHLPTARLVRFRAETHPDVPIRDAVCASIAIPAVFADTLIQGIPHYDAGGLKNYPIDSWGDQNPEAVGVSIADTDDEKPLRGRGILSTTLSVWRMVRAKYTEVEPSDEDRTLHIYTTGVGTTEFRMSRAKSWGLIEAGQIQSLEQARAKGMDPNWIGCRENAGTYLISALGRTLELTKDEAAFARRVVLEKTSGEYALKSPKGRSRLEFGVIIAPDDFTVYKGKAKLVLAAARRGDLADVLETALDRTYAPGVRSHG